MATRSFRWRINGGSWNYETEALPFNLSSVTAEDQVDVEPIGEQITLEAYWQSLVARDLNDAYALMDLDFAGSLFFYNGTIYDDEAAILAAVGGSVASSIYTFPPQDVPGAENLLSNGTFDSDTDGWTPNAGLTIASVSGELELVSTTGAFRKVSTPLTDKNGIAVKAAVTGRRSSGSGGFLAAGSNANSAMTGGLVLGSPTIATGSDEETSVIMGLRSSSWLGLRTSNTSADGTFYCDDFTATEVVPTPGWVASGGISFYLEFDAPGSTPSGDEVIFAGYDDGTGSGTNKTFLFVNSSMELVLRVLYYNNTSVDMTIATLTTGQACKLAVTIAPGDNGFTYASLDGEVASSDSTSEFPGIGYLKIGEDSDGSGDYSGSIDRFAVLNGVQDGKWCAAITAPAASIWMEGDSYVSGAGGVVLADTLNDLVDETVVWTAVGGTAIETIYARCQDYDYYLKSRPFVLWDGGPNGYTTAEEYCDVVQQIIDLLPHEMFILIPAATPYGGDTTIYDEMIAEMESRWPDNVLDWQDYLPHTSGVIDLSQMLNYPTDPTHLNQTAMDTMAAAIDAYLVVKGWIAA